MVLCSLQLWLILVFDHRPQPWRGEAVAQGGERLHRIGRHGVDSKGLQRVLRRRQGQHYWNTPNLSRGGLVVPVIACWWVDFPQHMQLVYAKHCGFCCCPKHALADFESNMEVHLGKAG